ncbi:glycosyltransferase family 2 protein [Sporomusa malonica]|uniref:Glycosyltransferase involved in cell wall bisynthesis n=1 Tax=Sporomusa malonica TaxID=112901 RepID=A0A1W2EUZ3_9FIRM|nr:glycosyltransferase family 2 protein [Sporomusa malonica]SMD13529.1 Glycosyltransferase involved in cell wall bisynthesis [Sporomusa malonica]
MHKPLVTVAIPTFNRPCGLQRTLKQITGQTYKNLEIIIGDNCSSSHETQTIINDLASKDKRIISYRHDENIGPFNNFKFLLNKASGEYFMWASDDDEWSSNFVSACMEKFTDNVGSVMSGIGVIIRGSGLRYKFPILEISPAKTIYENAIIFLNNMQSSLIYGIHKKSLIEWVINEQPFDWFDCYFVLKQIILNGYQIIPEYLYTAGVDGNNYVLKPFYPSAGRVFIYFPFYKACSDLILNEAAFTNEEKRRLLFLLTTITLSNFTNYEKESQHNKVQQPYYVLEQYLLDEKI